MPGLHDPISSFANWLTGFGSDPVEPVNVVPTVPTAGNVTQGTVADAALGASGQVTPDALANASSGWDWGNMGDLLTGIGKIGSVYGAIQTNRLMADQLDFQKSAFKTNLANQRKSYNLALDGQTRASFAQAGKTTAEADAYIKKFSM